MPEKDPETGKFVKTTRGDRPETREEEQVRADARAERVPLGTPQPKLQAPARQGYMRRWVNDTPGRIQAALRGSWTHVEDEHEVGEDGRGEKMCRTVGVKEDGSPLRAYLMEIPMELYEQDQKAKQRPLDDFDEQLKRGIIRGADPKDTDKYYRPDEGISISTG